MEYALLQARKAYDKGEIPVGAVIVDGNGVVIARSHNMVESKKTQCAHAEIRAIISANKKLKDWRLSNCWLYVTLEPCVMCMGLIMLSRLQGLVYATKSPLFGFHLDTQLSCQVYKSSAPIIVSGVGEQEAVYLLKQFFKKRRKER